MTRQKFRSEADTHYTAASRALGELRVTIYQFYLERGQKAEAEKTLHLAASELMREAQFLCAVTRDE